MNRIDKIKELLIENPDDAFLQHALALELIKIGDDIESKILFEKIIKDQPEYVGTYYHLAKLLERSGETEKAIAMYETGMREAKKAGETRAYNELRSAYEELTM